MIDKIVRKLKDVDFYRIFHERMYVNALAVENQEVKDVVDVVREGINIFYVKDKFAYFYATNDFDNLNNFDVLKAKKLPQMINYVPNESGIKDKKVIGKPTNLVLDDLVKQIVNVTKKNDLRIKENVANYKYKKVVRRIVSENTDIEETHYYDALNFNVVVRENKKIRSNYVKIAKASASDSEILNFIDSNSDVQAKTIKLLDYKDSLKGKFDIILDPDLSDVLAHEAIGHAMESDAVYNGSSVLSNQLGLVVAPKFVNMVDDPTAVENLYGSYYYDDEGFKAQPRNLIKNGKLNEYITTDKYAQLLKMKNNGGARVESYNNMPIPRMSNTSFTKGRISLDDMKSELKNGLILNGCTGGQTNPASGVFQFGVKTADLVMNGKIVDSYCNLSFSGNILDSLNNIVEISKENNYGQPGTCGKDGQGVPVAGFGPYMRINKIRIG